MMSILTMNIMPYDDDNDDDDNKVSVNHVAFSENEPAARDAFHEVFFHACRFITFPKLVS